MAWQAQADIGWLIRLPPDDKPWLPPKSILNEAAKVRSGVLSLERSITERELFGSASDLVRSPSHGVK